MSDRPTEEQFVNAARKKWDKEGECEVDEYPYADVSYSEDAGAYVQAWVWVTDEEAQDAEKSEA